MAMTLHVVPDDCAVEDVEGGKQRCGAVTFVVVRHSAGAASLHRQSWLGAVKRLDLAFFVNREHDCISGWIDVETDDVLELLCKLRIVRQLERADAMGRKLMGLKNALHRSQAHACRLRQRPSRPMGCCSRRRAKRQVDDPLHRGRRQWWLAGFARLVARQPVHAFGHKSRLPAPHYRLRLAGSPHDLGGTAAIGRRKDDFGTPNMLLRRVAIANDRFKSTAIARRDVDDNSCSHIESLNCFEHFGNRPNESDH